MSPVQPALIVFAYSSCLTVERIKNAVVPKLLKPTINPLHWETLKQKCQELAGIL